MSTLSNSYTVKGKFYVIQLNKLISVLDPPKQKFECAHGNSQQRRETHLCPMPEIISSSWIFEKASARHIGLKTHKCCRQNRPILPNFCAKGIFLYVMKPKNLFGVVWRGFTPLKQPEKFTLPVFQNLLSDSVNSESLFFC